MITFPWGVAVSGNDRVMPGRIGRTGRSRLILTPEYRHAKDKLYLIAKQQWKGRPIKGAVVLVGVLFPPDRRRVDCTAFSKIIMDALEGVCYVEDRQVLMATWRRADPDAKRAEILVDVRCVPDTFQVVTSPGGAAVTLTSENENEESER